MFTYIISLKNINEMLSLNIYLNNNEKDNKKYVQQNKYNIGCFNKMTMSIR